MDEQPPGRTGEDDLLEALAACLDELDVAAARFPGEPRFVVPISGRHGQYLCFVLADGPDLVRCTSHCPLLVPEDRRDQAARLLERVNAGLRLGAFELDADEGTVRFETAVDLDGERLGATVLAPLLFGNAMMLDDWLPSIIDVTYLRMDPDLAWAAGQARIDAEDG